MAIAFPGGSAAADTRIQSGSGSLSTDTGFDVLIGDVLIAGVKWEDSATEPTMSCLQVSSWTPLAATNNGGGPYGKLFYGTVTSDGATGVITATFTSGGAYSRLKVTRVRGLAASDYFDRNTEANGSSADPSTSAVTTRVNNEILFCLGGEYGAGTWADASGGVAWNIIDQSDGTMWAYAIVSSTGSYAGAFTHTSMQWTLNLATFADTAVGAGAAPAPNVADATTLTENTSLLFTPLVPPTIAQGVTVTEAVSLLRTPLVCDVSDAVTVSEDLSLSVSTVAPCTISVWETVVHHEEGEYPTIRLTPLLVDDYESVTTTEDVTWTTTITDAITKSTAQSITVTDAPSVLLPVLKVNVFDATTVTGVPTMDERGTWYPNVSDSVTVTEALDKGCPWVFPGWIGDGDGFTVTESVTIGLRSYIDKADAITVTESLAFSVSPALYITIVVFETVAVSEDKTGRLGNYVPEVADAVTVTDEPSISVLAVGTLLPEVYDEVTLTESVEALLVALVPAASDSVTLTEDVVLELVRRIDIDVSESVTTTETTTAVLTPLHPVVSDAITVGGFVDFTFNSSRQISVLESIAVTESADFGRVGSILRRRRRM